MKAVYFNKHGGPEVLEYGHVKTPTPNHDEVLVRLKYAAVNHLDIWVRRGLPGLSLSFPHIPGADGMGIIEETGSVVKNFKKGDKVIISPGLSCGVCESCLSGHDNLCSEYKIIGEHTWGTYSEYIVVPQINLLPCPNNVKDEEASSFGLVFLTAWQMVVEKVRLLPGDWALVTACGSGVSTSIIQLLKLIGVNVIASSSQEWKRKKCLEIGADYVVDTNSDLPTTIRKIVPDGVNVVFDNLGGQLWESLIRCLRKGGKLVNCGATLGQESTLNVRRVFFRNISIVGSTMGRKSTLFRCLELLKTGKIKPVIHDVLELKDAKMAHEMMEKGQVFGKLVLKISE